VCEKEKSETHTNIMMKKDYKRERGREGEREKKDMERMILCVCQSE